MRYKVINKCLYLGRVWEVGQVVELPSQPPHHFKPTSDEVNSFVAPKKDVMKPSTIKEKLVLSNVATKSKNIGFASSVEGDEIIPSYRELKNKKNKK